MGEWKKSRGVDMDLFLPFQTIYYFLFGFSMEA